MHPLNPQQIGNKTKSTPVSYNFPSLPVKRSHPGRSDRVKEGRIVRYCKLCPDFPFLNRTMELKHWLKEHREINCTACGEILVHPHAQHYRNDHMEDDDECVKCGAKITDPTELLQHERHFQAKK